MNSAIGFSLYYQAAEKEMASGNAAQIRALSHFPALQTSTIQVGPTTLTYWGRQGFQDSLASLPDGSMLLRVGSPVGGSSWAAVQKRFMQLPNIIDFSMDWDGRVVLLHISADGYIWTMWNDWVGTIPVYHAADAGSRVACTLEPVVVAAKGYTSSDFFLPGMISMMMNGHMIGDWTLYKNMFTVMPDTVSQWGPDGFRSDLCCTISGSNRRWETGWDDLLDEMHELVERAMMQVFSTQSSWILPLSSGLDSRLIAAIGASHGVNMHAYTWGTPSTVDGVYGLKIARRLGIPCELVNPGDQYLCCDTARWADLFGSSMHFHGMYQIPFFDHINRCAPPGDIVSGFLGDCHTNFDITEYEKIHTPGRCSSYIMPEDYLLWDIPALKTFCKLPVNDLLDEVKAKLEEVISMSSGCWFQKLMWMDYWNRQNRFTYFQTMLEDYWRGVAAPYINQNYARFSFSTPRALMDNRHFLIAMMKRYYPSVMSIPGTYGYDPAITTFEYHAKRRLERVLPKPLARRVVPEFFTMRNLQSDCDCICRDPVAATWPIADARPALEEFFNTSQLNELYQSAADGTMSAVRKLQAVQAVAYRLI
jgi:hypothetical protein